MLRILDGLQTSKGERLSYRKLNSEMLMGSTVLTASGPVMAIRTGKNNRTPIFVDLAGCQMGREEQVRAVTVFLVNRRTPARRRYADVAYVFQARLELVCPEGFRPRYNLSAYGAADEDLRVADLHYRDVEEYAVGRNTAAARDADDDGQSPSSLRP